MRKVLSIIGILVIGTMFALFLTVQKSGTVPAWATPIIKEETALSNTRDVKKEAMDKALSTFLSAECQRIQFLQILSDRNVPYMKDPTNENGYYNEFMDSVDQMNAEYGLDFYSFCPQLEYKLASNSATDIVCSQFIPK